MFRNFHNILGSKNGDYKNEIQKLAVIKSEYDAEEVDTFNIKKCKNQLQKKFNLQNTINTVQNLTTVDLKQF